MWCRDGRAVCEREAFGAGGAVARDREQPTGTCKRGDDQQLRGVSGTVGVLVGDDRRALLVDASRRDGVGPADPSGELAAVAAAGVVGDDGRDLVLTREPRR